MPDTRRVVNNVSSVFIIARRKDPGDIFIEVKDDGYPMAFFRRQLCLIGGNWIGDSAKGDQNPMDTAKRELSEEMSFDRPIRSAVELAQLGMADASQKFAPTPIEDVKPTDADVLNLAHLKEAVQRQCTPFGMFVNTCPKSLLDGADPSNKRDGFSGIACYWVSLLKEDQWAMLCALQDKFHNLSNESVTIVTSVDALVDREMRVAFGHDQPLQRFFLAMGIPRAKEMRIVREITSELVGTSPASYADLLEQYDILKKPV